MASNRKPRNSQGPAITKTMFYFEGNPVASLVINYAGTRREIIKEFARAEDALAWCRKSGCTLVYSPIDLVKN